jgi:chemotaxis signal transduction protein
MTETDDSVSPLHQLRGILFRLHQSWFIIDLMRVRQVLRFPAVTARDGVPSLAAGTITYRGEEVLLLDLFRRLHLPEAPPGPSSRILILAMPHRLLGICVHEVAGLRTIPREAIGPSSSRIPSCLAPFFIGEALVGGDSVTLLNIDRLFTPDDERCFAGSVQQAGSDDP